MALPRTSIFSIRKRSSKWSPAVRVPPPLLPRLLSVSSKGISLCPTTVISSNPRKLGGEISWAIVRMKLKIRTLSKIIHKISRRDYVEEYNSMEFKNIEDIGEGMLLDKKKKKIAKHSSFLFFFFFTNIRGIHSLLPRRSFSSVNYSTFVESFIEWNSSRICPIFINNIFSNKDISKVDV